MLCTLHDVAAFYSEQLSVLLPCDFEDTFLYLHLFVMPEGRNNTEGAVCPGRVTDAVHSTWFYISGLNKQFECEALKGLKEFLGGIG